MHPKIFSVLAAQVHFHSNLQLLIMPKVYNTTFHNFTDVSQFYRWLHVSMYVLLLSVFYILRYFIYAAKNNNILCVWQVQH